MREADDYNDEYFFDKEYELEEYQNILRELDEPTPADEAFMSDIMVLEQAMSIIQEQLILLSPIAEEASAALDKFIQTYGEYYS